MHPGMLRKKPGSSLKTQYTWKDKIHICETVHPETGCEEGAHRGGEAMGHIVVSRQGLTKRCAGGLPFAHRRLLVRK